MIGRSRHSVTVTAPLPEPHTMSFTIKLGHNGRTRRLTHPDPPTWDWLAAKVSELYKIPRDDVAASTHSLSPTPL
jgi:hypothetical protein